MDKLFSKVVLDNEIAYKAGQLFVNFFIIITIIAMAPAACLQMTLEAWKSKRNKVKGKNMQEEPLEHSDVNIRGKSPQQKQMDEVYKIYKRHMWREG